jgi:uncharacterized protein (DUF1330 family)/catechol 2,3-dioxygenase-like lactoylglutathione lyase family enzyme
MPAYVVAMMSIHDPVTYREYTDRTPATVKKHGGKFLTRGEPVTTVEGEEYKDRMVILEFPSTAQVQAWFADPAYQEAMAFRHASSTMRLLVVQEGGGTPKTRTPIFECDNAPDMTIKRLDHINVVVDDLAAAIAFFTALGMTLDGEMPIEGPWVDRVNGLEGVQVDIVMMRTPDGHGRLELTKFRNPKLVETEPTIAPPNTLGLRSVMFTVENLDDTVARLQANGAELVGEVAQYEDQYRLCYMRGPAGIIVALAEELF